MKNAFSIQRLGKIIARDFASGQKSWLKMFLIQTGITSAIFLVVLHIAWISNEITANTVGMMFRQMANAAFVGILTIGGSISASMAFEEVHDRGRGIAFLMLPATRLEKWLSAFVPSLLMYGGLATLAFSVSVFIASTGFALYHGATIPAADAWTSFQPEHLATAFKSFVAAHAVYFLGSIWFQKNHWMNTTLWLIGSAIALGLMADALPAWLLGSDVKLSENAGKWFANVQDDGFFSLPVAGFWHGLEKGLGLAAVPFLWLLSFLRFNEKEI